MTETVTTIGIGVDSRPVTAANFAVDKLIGALGSVETAINKFTESTKRNNESQKEQKTAAERFIEALKRENEEIGKNAQQLREIEAKRRGATEAQLAEIKVLGESIDKNKAATAAQTAMKEGANALGGALGIVSRGTLALTAAYAAFEGIKAFAGAQEDAKVLLARITNITGSLSEARVVYRGLQEDSIKLRVSGSDVLEGFVRIAGAVKELGGSATQARKLNEVIIATAKISGIAAEEAAAAARQFAQALGSGVLQGDELRSILENNQELARQLAKGLNVSVGELRKLGEQGKLTADIVAQALLGRLPEIEKKLAGVPLTSVDAWQKLKTVTGQWIFEGDKVEVKAGLIARAMNGLADAIDRVNKSASQTPSASVALSNLSSPVENEGGAAFVSPNLGRSAKAAQARNAALAELDQEIARIGRDRSIADAALGVANAVKTADEALNKALEGRQSNFEKFGTDLSKTIGAANALEAALNKQREAAIASGQGVGEIDNALARLAATRDKINASIGGGLAEANKADWDKIEKTMRIGVDRQIEEFDRLAAASAKQRDLILAGLDTQRAAVEEQYRGGLITYSEYVAQVESLQATEINTRRNGIETERTFAEEKGKLYQGVVDRIAQQLGNEAAMYSDSAKQIAQTELQRTEALVKRAQVETTVHNESTQRNQQTLSQIRDIARAEQARLDNWRKFGDAQFESFRKSQEAAEDIIRAQRDEVEQLTFELTLIGKSVGEQARLRKERELSLEITKAQVELDRILARSEDRGDGLQIRPEDVERWDMLTAKIAALKTAAAEIPQAVGDAATWREISGDITDWLMSGFRNTRDLVKRLFERLILQPTIQPIVQQLTGGIQSLLFGGGAGGAGGGSGILSSLFGGGGLDLGGLLGGGLSSLFGMNLSAGFGGLFGGASQILSGTIGGMTQLGLGFGEAFSGAIQAIGGFGSALGAAIPVIGAIVAIASALGVFDNETGIKIDNSVRDGRGRKDIINGAALGAFDVSGDIGNDAFKPLIDTVFKLDKFIADNLLGEETLARVRENIQRISSDATDWFGFDDEASAKVAIEKASKVFLQQRYSTAFDEIDREVAGMIRNFSGSADELIQFITRATQSVQVLEDLSDAIPSLNLSLAQFLDLTEQEQADLATIAAILPTLGQDITQLATDAYDTQTGGIVNAFIKQGDALDDLLDKFNRGEASVSDLAAATVAFGNSAVSVIAALAAARDQVNNDIAGGIRTIQTTGLDKDQLNDFLRNEAEALRAQLQVTNDPAKINELVQRIIANSTQVFSSLSPEQQAQYRQEFIDGLTTLQTEANARIKDLNDIVLANTTTTFDAARKGFEGVVDKFNKGASDTLDAANTLNDAADKIDDTFTRGIDIRVTRDTAAIGGLN